MKLNVSEKIAVSAASYVMVAFLIIAGSSARVSGQAPGEIALQEARAKEAAEAYAGQSEQVTDSDRGKGKAHGKATGDAAILNRISRETGVTVATLLTEKSSTELSYGDLEIAHLLAKASGQRFDGIVAKFKAGENWEKIAHDMGLTLGKIVSDAHRPGSKNEGRHLGQTNSDGTSKPSTITPYGIRADSVIFEGITPIPRAGGGANSSRSSTTAQRP